MGTTEHFWSVGGLLWGGILAEQRTGEDQKKMLVISELTFVPPQWKKHIS